MEQKTITDTSKLNLKYEKLILNLTNDVKKAETGEEKNQILKNFSENYLMPEKFWKKRLNIESYGPDINNVLNEVLFHFSYTDRILDNYFDFNRFKICDYYRGIYPHYKNLNIFLTENELEKCKNDLMFPHCYLREYLADYKKALCSPISPTFEKHVEKMEALFWKIRQSRRYREKWFNCLKESGDSEFVKHNVENFLGKNLNNIKLWKLYINYLKEINPKEMLQVYSKYCRYFLDDFEMKKEYKKDAEKYGPVYVKWKNLYDFEFERSMDVDTSAISNATNLDTKVETLCQTLPEQQKFICPNIDFNKAIPQEWDLPKPIIDYITSITQPSISQKLQQTCKYFFKYNRILYCYKAIISNEINELQYKEDSMLVPLSMLKFKAAKKKLYITTVLCFSDYDNPKNLSQYIQNSVYECDIKFLEIRGQILQQNEMEFLIKNGNLESLFLFKTEILKENGIEKVMLEEILKWTPKIQFLNVDCLQSANTLSTLKFMEKIIDFQLWNIASILSVKDFAAFIEINGIPLSIFSIYFDSNIDLNLIKVFKQNVKAEIKNSKLNQRPKFFVDGET